MADMKLSLAQLAQSLGLNFQAMDCEFENISINTKTLNKGDLFVAIKGENFDAHDFLDEVKQKGACALVVEKCNSVKLPQLQVADTRIALGTIASLWRQNYHLPIVAITGSCGKTTVKEMTSKIFQYEKQCVLATQGNLNNDIGVPLTLLRLNKEHKMAVIEMGANHLGEIKQLVTITQPDIAVITNVAHAHIEGFGSIDGIAKAKAEIYSGLNNKGVAIINADDPYAHFWQQKCQQLAEQKEITSLSFGLDHNADISATYQTLSNGIDMRISTPEETINVHLNQYGKHTIYNALAATSVALAAQCSIKNIKLGLENFTNITGRLEQKKGLYGSVIFDDTYNANPGSVIAGVNAIQQIEGEHIVVLGDMGELGQESKTLHYELGVAIAKLGIEQLLTVGSHSLHISDGFNHTIKDKAHKALHFSDKKTLIAKLTLLLKQNAKTENILLIKGSRTMKMEEVVMELLEENTSKKDIK